MIHCTLIIFVTIFLGSTLAETTTSVQSTFSKVSSISVSPDCYKLNPATLTVLPIPVGESVWFVGKIFTDPNAPPLTPGTPTSTPATAAVTPPPSTTPPINMDNRCNVLKFGADCGAMKILMLKDEDDSLSMKKAGFNSKTNTVALYKLDLLTSALSKSVIKTEFGYYGLLEQSGLISFAEVTPQELKDEQNTELVLVGSGENKEFLLFCTCNKSAAFVLYAEKIVAEGKTKDFDTKITELITTLQLDPAKLKDVPFEFTIPVDKFIPSLISPP